MPARLLTVPTLLVLLAAPLRAQNTPATERDSIFAVRNSSLEQAQPTKSKDKDDKDKKDKKEKEDKKDEGSVRLLVQKPPSLRFGKALRIDFRGKIQMDWRGFDPDVNTKTGLFELHRRRAAVEGTFLKDFEYQVEGELDNQKDPWRDLYVDYKPIREFGVQGGKFKEPFSMDELAGDMNLGFAYRSLVAVNLAPARDTGVMGHGRFFKKHDLSYQFGWFNRDGENARITEPFFLLPGEPPPATEHSVAGRVTYKVVKDLTVGGAFTSSRVPEGLNSLPARTVFRKTFFPRVFVKGQRLRLGTEAAWTPGTLAIKAEYIRVADERKNQGLRDVDLPDVIGQGYYVSGLWVMVGKKDPDKDEPTREFPAGGFGALELAARFEELRFGSHCPEEPAFRNPRACNLLENRDRALTFGVTWYMNRFTKVQLNGVRELIKDTERSPKFGLGRYWAAVSRLQFVL